MDSRLTRVLRLTKSPETVAPLDRAFANHVRDVNTDLDLLDTAISTIVGGGFVDIPTGDARWVNVGGDTMTGNLIVNARVGLNTSTPGTINGTVPGGDANAFPLHVKRSGAGSTYAVVDGSGAVGVLLNDAGQAFDGRLWAFEVNGGNFLFRTYTDAGASTTRLGLDRSGVLTTTNSVGVAVSPAPWGSAYRVVSISAATQVYGSSSQGGITRNLYWDGSIWRTVIADTAEGIQMFGGHVYVQNAPTGTVGGAASLTTRLHISPAGLLDSYTVPECRVTHSVDQAAPSGATTLAFNSERYDTDAIHDTATNNSRLVCKTPGKYLIWAHVAFSAGAGTYRQVNLFLNGTTNIDVVVTPPVSGTTTNLNPATVWDLAVNDYVQVIVAHDVAGGLNVLKLDAWSPEFGMIRVG